MKSVFINDFKVAAALLLRFFRLWGKIRISSFFTHFSLKVITFFLPEQKSIFAGT